MSKRGVYVSALIEKRCYWHRGVYGNAINYLLRSKNSGDIGCLSSEWDETEFNIFF